MTIATKNSTTARRGVGFIVPHAFIFVTMLGEIFKEDGITIMCHSSPAWQLLSIFLSTIAGLVLGPLPVGAWAFLGLTATVATGTLPFTAAFGAFTNEVIWLIVISFFFARGFVKTGLGDRVATYFVKWLGGSTLGLSYGLTISEACIAPAMPSTTARAGGVFLPIVKSLSLSAGSKPNDPSAKKLGAYLVQSQLQVHFAQMVINFSRDR
ncbi:2-oxoglutarate/malate translocator, chloroplastic [Triticum urartu]|uniref:2-oxoglutarate/malate translocator, chloroplastic n=1 Tax=Triticum urartu TaxID=4572 RepID=M7YF06_TRIUA|nr:2-oxoglutarate/malate translocator, chloroplastic [Triticum urartu]